MCIGGGGPRQVIDEGVGAAIIADARRAILMLVNGTCDHVILTSPAHERDEGEDEGGWGHD